jgi:hypothetical protein
MFIIADWSDVIWTRNQLSKKSQIKIGFNKKLKWKTVVAEGYSILQPSLTEGINGGKEEVDYLFPVLINQDGVVPKRKLIFFGLK